MAVIQDLSIVDIDTTKLDSKLRKSERKRKQFQSRLGPADPIYCISCHTKCGFAGLDTNCIFICRECEQKGLSIPLIAVENIGVYCLLCKLKVKSVPRDIADKIVYYCEDCEKKLESKPPLVEMTKEEEIALGIR